MRIGVLGGTFDPPHLSHTFMANEAVNHLNLDSLLVVPSPANPFKGSVSTPSEHRYKMVLRAFRHHNDDGKNFHLMPNCDKFQVTDIEFKRSGLSYMSDTLLEIHKMYPDDEKYLVVGDDILAGLPKWHNIEDICKIVKIAVLPRLYDCLNLDKRKELVYNYYPDFLVEAVEFIDTATASHGSSTFFREHHNDVDSLQGYMDIEVLKYIQENHLYGY